MDLNAQPPSPRIIQQQQQNQHHQQQQQNQQNQNLILIQHAENYKNITVPSPTSAHITHIYDANTSPSPSSSRHNSNNNATNIHNPNSLQLVADSLDPNAVTESLPNVTPSSAHHLSPVSAASNHNNHNNGHHNAIPMRKKSSLATKQSLAEKKRNGKFRNRGISFADDHNRPLVEVHEIESRAPKKNNGDGCCLVQ